MGRKRLVRCRKQQVGHSMTSSARASSELVSHSTGNLTLRGLRFQPRARLTSASGHAHYVQANREKQRERDRRRHGAKAINLAKMDSIGGFSVVPSGTYLLVPQGEENLAKMDSIMVKITLFSKR
jgi:hypothetical protein